MNRREFLIAIAAGALPLALPGSVMAGFLDAILDPNSKESKILSGTRNLLGSTQEMSFKNERILGENLAIKGFQRYGLPVRDKALQHYVNLVGMAVATNSPRPNIPYRFVVVDSRVENAFSCPGGIVFISSALVRTIRSEAQLACILGHEVGHVALRHALKSIRRAQFFSGVGQITSATMKGDTGKQLADAVNQMQDVLFDKGLDKNMEYEADASGMETAYRTGYDPEGLTEALRGLQKVQAHAIKKGSWFTTHPPIPSRIARNERQMRQYPDAGRLAVLAGRYKARTKA